jgi:hypothetical protein
MPTPFTHLYVAQRLLDRFEDSADTCQERARVSAVLRRCWPAFCLGSVAPDVQEQAGLSREATHFYTLPPESDADGVANLLARYPDLAGDRCHSDEQAAFVAGYLTHLQLDLLWFRKILLPHFVAAPDLGEIEARVLLHNLTLIVLDQRHRTQLPPVMGTTLHLTQPDRWLPFVGDEHLVAWRDHLAGQLVAGATSETVAIYAQRMSIPAADLQENVNDVQWLQTNLLARVPVTTIEAQLDSSVDQCLALVESYWRARES